MSVGLNLLPLVSGTFPPIFADNMPINLGVGKQLGSNQVSTMKGSGTSTHLDRPSSFEGLQLRCSFARRKCFLDLQHLGAGEVIPTRSGNL